MARGVWLRASRLFRVRGDGLGLRDPAFDATGQSDFLADLVGGGGLEVCDLPIMEDAEIVELLFDRRRDPDKLLQVVGDAARAGQRLELALVLRKLFHDRLRRRAGIDSAL